MPVRISRLTEQDVPSMHDLSTMFGEVFDDRDSYITRRPSDAYLARWLARDSVFALVAVDDHTIVGGLVAYELPKFEQERSEIYIYDLAVRAEYRRRGVATALIAQLQALAAARGAWVIFVQSDTAPEDAAAIALYTKLGRREDVLHFDIPVVARA